MKKVDIFLLCSGALFVVVCIVSLTYGLQLDRQAAQQVQAQPQIVIVRYECAKGVP